MVLGNHTTDYSISIVSANYFSMHRIIQVIAIVAVYYRLKWNEERHIQCFTLNRDNRQWNDQSGGRTSVTIFVADAHVSLGEPHRMPKCLFRSLHVLKFRRNMNYLLCYFVCCDFGEVVCDGILKSECA